MAETISDFASQGGKARKKALTPERRTEIARRAVEARWIKEGKSPIPRATHIGCLNLGNARLDCAVLDTGDRVIFQRAFLTALGITKSGSLYKAARNVDGGGVLPLFVAHSSLKPFISNDLTEVLSNPIKYVPSQGGRLAFGIKAEFIPRVCEVWLNARDSGALTTKGAKGIAAKADILMRGLAHVGIIALIDEATGYEDVRERRALAKILEAFIAKELRPWVHTFPVDYYKQLFRLRGLEYPPEGNKMPQYVGVLTNDIVYKRLAPGVLEELKRTVPKTESGRRKHHFHRKLTNDIGHPKLLQHLGSVVALMKISPDRDYKAFKKMLDQHYPPQTALPLFDGEISDSAGNQPSAD